MKGRKEKKRFWIILFMVVIMIGTSFSFVFFGFSPAEGKVKYGNFLFTLFPNDNIWVARVSGQDAAFSFLPKEVEGINMSLELISKLQGKLEIDATYDINSTHKESIALAYHQLGLTLAAYGVYLRQGFTSNNTFNLPVIRCSDATANVPVIYFRHANSTKIYSENSCIIAEAPSGIGFIRIKDRLLYGMLGVMK